MMEKSFQIIIGSPVDYDQLVAYIVINGDHVALLNQDEGADNLKIEFFDEPKIKSISFDLFTEALQEAKIVLCG
jgi:hypothetical protein